MAAELSTFAPIAGVDGASSATKGGLRCTAIVLRSGALCLYSPVAGLTTHAKASLDALGPVAVLRFSVHGPRLQYLWLCPRGRTILDN